MTKSDVASSSAKCILTYGTFDLFHIGHFNLLRRAKSLGNRLIVGVSTDQFNIIKGKYGHQSFEYRKSIIESLGFVDLVIPEDGWEQKEEDIKAHQVDVFVMGDDWEGKFDSLRKHCEVVYFPRTAGVSTTDLKQKMSGLR